MTIYGYGKWVDKTFDLSSDYHVIYGENEAGKSTLMSFIHSILFGFPTRHSALLRYEPKDSSRYGGKLIVEDERFGEVSIERVQGKSTGDVKVLMEDGATGSDELLHKLVYGIDRNLYQSVFSFHLKGIERVEEMTKEQLNRYFLSAGALGTEQFLQRADQFKQQANQLYKPTGRVPEINRAIKQLDTKKKAMETAKSRNAEYLDLLQRADTLKKEIDQHEVEQKKLQDKIENLRQVEQNWETVEEINQLETEIEQLNTSNLSENGLYELNHLNQQIEEVRKKIHELQDMMKEFQNEYEPSDELILYQDNEKSIDALAVQIESINDMIREKMYIDREADRVEQELIKGKIQEGLEVDEMLSSSLTSKEHKEIMQWQKEFSEIESELKKLEDTLNQIEYKRISLEENIDQLEEQLWSNEVFRQEKDYHEKQKENEQKKHLGTIEIILISSLTVVLVTAMVLNFSISWIIYILSVFMIILCLISLGIKTKWNKRRNQDYSTYEKYIEQKEVRRQWRQYLFNVDKLEGEKRESQTNSHKLSNERLKVLAGWEELKTRKRMSRSVQLLEALNYAGRMDMLRKSEKELEKLKEASAELGNAVFLKTEQFDKLDRLFAEDDTPEQKASRFKAFYSKVKEEKNRLQQYVIESQETRRTLDQLVESEKECLNKKQSLLKAAGADSEEVFRHLYGILRQKNEKEERLKVLKEQLPINAVKQLAHSREHIQEQRMTLQENVNNTNRAIKEQTEQKIELEVHVKKLEEGGEYTALLQEFENEKSALQELVNDWVSKRLASYMIEKTLKYARKDRFPDTIKDAERYFSYLTDDMYNKITIDDESIYVLSREGNYFKADELSRGTAEPLYVALRLAFISNIQDIIRMPLLIDDGFVNLDHARRAKMYELLKEISQKTQVLYFSFDRQSYDRLSDSQITLLTK